MPAIAHVHLKTNTIIFFKFCYGHHLLIMKKLWSNFHKIPEGLTKKLLCKTFFKDRQNERLLWLTSVVYITRSSENQIKIKIKKQFVKRTKQILYIPNNKTDIVAIKCCW